ncbi:hypothetical protein LINPERHAP2_LOCUS20731 [Linum perenne]
MLQVFSLRVLDNLIYILYLKFINLKSQLQTKLLLTNI